uniref:Protein Asterix n=1 Tax=Macrostomum lignano TaxID=282301 RepID=A0A1I8FGI0_9PLAT
MPSDTTPDTMNLLGMVFSIGPVWMAVFCAFVSFANSRSSEDTKQILSSFMLSISAVVISYLQNPPADDFALPVLLTD